jgi:hypothetical protein
MFPEQLKKILNIIKKTHDRVIIFDGNKPDDTYVIMNLDSYVETAVKADQPAKIAQPETAVAEPLKPAQESAPGKPELSPKSGKIENLTEEDLTDKINREISMWKNQENAPYLGEENKVKKAWQIPPIVKDKAQEVE